MVLLVHKGQWVLLGQSVRKVYKVTPELSALKDLRDYKDYLVLLGHKVKKATRVIKETKDFKVSQASMVLSVHKGQWVLLGQKVNREPMVSMELPGQSDRKGHKVRPELMEPM